MKKEYFAIVFLIFCIVIVITGIIKVLNFGYKKQQAQYNSNEIIVSNNVIETASVEEKLSPNATFALMKYYDECSHYDYEEAELPYELINLTRQEIEDLYDDWEVQDFSTDKLVLEQEIDGYCNQHYLIKLDNGNVVIYRMKTNGEFEVYCNTSIAEEFLPEDDISALKDGIVLYGYDNVSSILEDFE